MQKRAPRIPRRFVSLAATVAIAALVAACTGRGGGWLPPDGVLHPAQATIGFTFSCERKNMNTNAPTGQLRIEMAYLEQGPTLEEAPLLAFGTGFGIHGIADVIDPQLESGVCIGQNPPPDGKLLIFLGRYRMTTSAPAGFPAACATTKWTKANCRFEVQVKDNDLNRAPSRGDWFSIQLSTVTEVCEPAPDPDQLPTCITEFPAGTVFYSRAGVLGGGNMTVN